jgi:hypothetical protein
MIIGTPRIGLILGALDQNDQPSKSELAEIWQWSTAETWATLLNGVNSMLDGERTQSEVMSRLAPLVLGRIGGMDDLRECSQLVMEYELPVTWNLVVLVGNKGNAYASAAISLPLPAASGSTH